MQMVGLVDASVIPISGKVAVLSSLGQELVDFFLEDGPKMNFKISSNCVEKHFFERHCQA